jgi:translation initiation factor 1
MVERRLVYDSDAPLNKPGRAPRTVRDTEPPRALANLPRDGVVRLLRDRKGRGGKTVTLIAGLTGTPAALAALTSELKRACGTGGTVRGDVIEIQGDVRDRLRLELERRGYTVKIAGG